MVQIYIEGFCQKIKNLREEKNLTQEALADLLGISRQSIISVERGKCLPSLPLALRIAEAFNETIESLFLSKENINDTDEEGGEKNMPRHIIPWSPFSDLERFFDEDDTPGARWRSVTFPLMDVKQTEKDVIVTADIPGVKEEDLNIEVGEDFVDISGEKKEETEEKEEGYFRREVSYGSFHRRVPLPSPVKAEKAEAVVKEGRLKLTLPKLEPAKPKTTKIKVKKA